MRATNRNEGTSRSRRGLERGAFSLGYRWRTDVDLMGLARAGNHAAFDELVCRYRDRLYGMAFVALKDEARAGDAVCEALASAFRGIAHARDGSTPGAWFYLNLLRVISSPLSPNAMGLQVRHSRA